MAHITKDKGDLAVAKAITHLLEHDIRVCMPLSEHLPFDFIAVMPDMTTLRRVQVKYRTKHNTGVIKLDFRSNYYNSKKIYTVKVNLDEIDSYAVYCPDTDETYYINTSEFPHDLLVLCLRVDPVRNGQQKGVWLAEHYTDPRRLALVPKIELPPEQQTNRETAFATAQVIQHLMMQGWYTATPYLNHDQPFDLIAVSPDMMRLLRIRVGCGMTDMTPYADAYAIYDPAAKAVHYLNAGSVNAADRCVGLATQSAMSSMLETALVG